ncbi:NADase-type glycan-binding domain-containing protein [Nocardioides speluncae]|uniref:NADase-type glycan-binding domain-containing protein n=1 Tax=Nocardioides speluncae TaxID=2670337 RepID=UPI0012B162BA|nr:hypothetical protein [Nocardioides speluncae]
MQQPVAPPPVQPIEVESSARYPLFADEVPAAHTQMRPDESADQPSPYQAPPADIGWAPTPGHTAPPSPSDQPTVHRPPQRQERRGGIGSGWLIFAASLLCLLLIGGFAIWLLGGGDDDKKQDVSSEPTGKPNDKESPGSDTPPDDPDNPTDIARFATAVVPSTAPPGEDVRGNPVRFDARNMLDGDPATAWRMKREAPSPLIFELAEESVITQVGLINGYAKTDRDPAGNKTNWYMRNRRILQVEWIFDDGQTVQQTLGTSMQVQTVKVPDVTTKQVQLRIVSIGPPPEAHRDFTVISEVSLVGAPPA